MICASCQGDAPSTATHCPRCGEPLAAPASSLVAAAQVAASAAQPPEPLWPLAGPWARYWARSLDVLLLFLLVAAVIIGTAPAFIAPFMNLPELLQAGLAAVVLVPVALVLDALIYRVCGNTLGKWLVGLRVADLAGRRLSLRGYLERNLGVFVRGLGFGIPVIGLFTLLYNWGLVNRGELTAWDRGTDARAYRVRGGLVRTTLTATIYLTLALAIAAANLFLSLASPEQQLRVFVAFANKGTPTTVGEHIRLERVTLLPGKVMQYDFTLLDATSAHNMAHRDPQRVRTTLARNLCEQLHTVLYDLDGSLHWRYLDTHGETLLAVELSKQDCESPR